MITPFIQWGAEVLRGSPVRRRGTACRALSTVAHAFLRAASAFEPTLLVASMPMCPLRPQRKSAVNGDNLAGDEIRGEQVDDCFRDLFAAPWPAHGRHGH